MFKNIIFVVLLSFFISCSEQELLKNVPDFTDNVVGGKLALNLEKTSLHICKPQVFKTPDGTLTAEQKNLWLGLYFLLGCKN